MTYSFEIEFSNLFNQLEYELEESVHVYTIITNFSNWTTLDSKTKVRELELTIIYEPDFEKEKSNRLKLSIWYRPTTKTYYATLKQPYSSVLKIVTKQFKFKDYQKLLKLLNKYKPK